jgi:hypothetical protein
VPLRLCGRKTEAEANGMARRKQRTTANQWFNFTRDSYLERTSRPIYAIVFLLPFIVFYELGTIFINTDVLSQTQVRVVAFVWMQELLGRLGFGGKFLWAMPALVAVVILLAYQLVSKKRWWVSLNDMIPMTIECVLYAIPLIVLSLFLNSATAPKHSQANNISQAAVVVQCAATQNKPQNKPQYQQPPKATTPPPVSAKPKPQSSLLADIVTGIGAGIYEELMFRLILICALMLLLQDVLGINQHSAVIISVLVSAALFGAHHHIDFLTGRANPSDIFDWSKFAFRTTAGVYFAALFAIRGFGITAGTHAFYDIIATLINVLVFQR